MGSIRQSVFGLVVIFVTATVLPGCSAHSKPDSGSVAVAGSEEHDFGEVRQGSVLFHSFILNNNTAQDMWVTQLSSSCGCLNIENAKELCTQPLFAGQTTPVNVCFRVPGARDSATVKAVVTYRLSGDQPGLPERFLNLVVRATIRPDYVVTPTEVDFGTIDGIVDELVTREIQITPDAEQVRVLSVSSPCDFLSAALVPATVGEMGGTVKVTLDPSQLHQGGVFRGHIVLATDSPRAAIALIQVRGVYIASVDVEPSVVIIDSGHRGDVKRELKLTSSRPCKIRSVTSPVIPLVSAAFDGAQMASSHSLSLRVKEFGDSVVNTYLELNVEMVTLSGQLVTRKFRVAIHRFSRGDAK